MTIRPDTPGPLRVIGVFAAWRPDRVRPVQGNLDPPVHLAGGATWPRQSDVRSREVRVDDGEAQVFYGYVDKYIGRAIGPARSRP